MNKLWFGLATAVVASMACAAGYRVQYVEANGTQYIDTGVSYQPTDRIVVEGSFASGLKSQQVMIGWRSSGSKEALSCGAHMVSNVGKFAAQCSNASTYRDVGDVDTGKHTFDICSGSQKFDGVEFATDTLTLPISSGSKGSGSGRYYLFGSSNGWSDGGKYYNSLMSGRLYSCQIYQKNALVRDFVPYVQDGVAGMYDQVEGKFYGATVGGNTLVAGPLVENFVKIVSDNPLVKDLVTPAVGEYVLGDESSILCSAEGASDESLQATLLGYTLYPLGEFGERGAGVFYEGATSYTYEGGAYEIEWNYDVKCKLNLSAINEKGTFNIESGWVDYGEEVTIICTPVAGENFYYWTGDVVEDQISQNPLTVTMDQARAIVANFDMQQHVFTEADGRYDLVIHGVDTVEVDVGLAADGTYNVFTLGAANSHSGGTHIKSGALRIENESALGHGPIVCESGTAIILACPFDTKTINEAVIDRVTVVPASEGETHVAILLGDATVINGNNVLDFSAQPDLWVGCAKGYSCTCIKYVPYIDQENTLARYQVGYFGDATSTLTFLNYGSIADVTVTSADGKTKQTFGGRLFTRGIGKVSVSGSYNYDSPNSGTKGYDLGGSVHVIFGSDRSGVGRGVSALMPNFFTLRDQAVLEAAATQTLGANLGIYVAPGASAGIFNVGRGGYNATALATFSGPLSGPGNLRFCGGTSTYNAQVCFRGDASGFTGSLKCEIPPNGNKFADFMIGDPNGSCSWGGTIDPDSEPFWFTVDCGQDVTLANVVPPKGTLYKRGAGTLTLATPLSERVNATPDMPVAVVEGGTIRLGVSDSGMADGTIVLSGADTTFDLAGMAAGATLLPRGSGSVVGAGDGVKFHDSSSRSDRLFTGSIDGGVTVDISGEAWALAGADIAGPLVLERGRVSLRKWSEFESLAVEDNGWLELDFNGGTGLTAVFCNNNSKAFPAVPKTNELVRAQQMLDITPETADVSDDGSLYDSSAFAMTASQSISQHDPFHRYFLNSKYVCAAFHGYFYAPADGDYKFYSNVDDTQYSAYRIDGVNVQRATLTKGWHAISIAAARNQADWNPVFPKPMLKSNYENTAAMLRPAVVRSDLDFTVGELAPTGTGTISLGAYSSWPETLSLAGFSGRIVGNESGDELPCAATASGIGFSTAGSHRDRRYEYQATRTIDAYGDSSYVSSAANGVFALVLDSGSGVPTNAPWRISFDAKAEGAYKPTGNMSLTAAIQPKQYGYLLRDVYAAGFVASFDKTTGNLTGIAAKGGSSNGDLNENWGVTVVDSCEFEKISLVGDLPVNMEVVYDGESTLFCTVRQGSCYLRVKNDGDSASSIAERKLHDKYVTTADRKPHATVLNNIGCSQSVRISNVQLAYSRAPELDGDITLTGGDVSNVIGASGALKGNIMVAGDVQLNIGGELMLEPSSLGFTWKKTGTTMLSLLGAVSFPEEPICVGPCFHTPIGNTKACDWSEAIVMGGVPTFTGASSMVQDDALWLHMSGGTLLMLR